MLDLRNQLNEPWDRYQKRRIGLLCQEIPPSDRERILEEIQVRSMFQSPNPIALKEALKRLNS